MRSILIPAIKSLTVTDKNPDKNLNEDILTVGSDGNYNYYSYLFFDTSSIPCNAIISKAELILFKVDKFYNDDNKKNSISPLKEYFSTYTTYNNPPRYDSYTTINFYPLTSKVSISINITTIISSWAKNQQTNKGLILYEKIENGITNFASVKSDDKPFIRVTYKDYTAYKCSKENLEEKHNCRKKCDCNNKCHCNKNCHCNDNCGCNKNCVKICKDELKAILIEVCKEVCCNNCNPNPDSTVRQVRVTGTVEPLSVYFIVVNIEVIRADSGVKDNYYVSDKYDNSLNNTQLYIDQIYNVAIIPKIKPGDTENLTLYGSYKGPISV